MENKSGLVARIAAILLGVMALLAAYFWVHKPGGSIGATVALAGTLGVGLAQTGIVAALVVIAGGVGRAALFRLDLTPLSRAEHLALCAALGLGMISVGALLLGMVGLYNVAALWLPLIALALLLRRFVGAWLRDGRDLLAGLPIESAWTRYLSLLIGVLLALAFLRALAPPTAWDALTYHLVGPQRYLADGRIAAHADNHFLGFPQVAEVLYGVAMSPLGDGSAGALLHFSFGMIGLAAAAGLTRRYTEPAAGWLTVMLLLSAHSVWLLLGWAYVDLAVLAYGAVAFTVATRWRETGGVGWLILLGALTGFAFGVKYTSIGLGFALAVFIIARQPRRGPLNLIVYGLAALVTFAPWLLKGALLYDNPVYPFLFGGLNWDAARSANFGTFGSGLLGTPDAWQLALLPLSATVFGVERGGGFAFTAGAWLLTAPLLLVPGWVFLEGRARALARDGLLLALPLLLFWLGLAAISEIGVQTRLIAMALPVAAVLGSLGFHALWQFPEKPVQIAFIVRAALAVTLALGVVEAAREFAAERTLPYLLALESRDAYLDANLGAYANAMRELETHVPPGAHVLLLWEPRSYYCPPTVTCQPDILFDHWARPLQTGATAAEVIAGWHAAGVDYVLLWQTGFEGAALNPSSAFSGENAQFAAARDAAFEPVWTDGVRYTLYTFAEPAATATRPGS